MTIWSPDASWDAPAGCITIMVAWTCLVLFPLCLVSALSIYVEPQWHICVSWLLYCHLVHCIPTWDVFVLFFKPHSKSCILKMGINLPSKFRSKSISAQSFGFTSFEYKARRSWHISAGLNNCNNCNVVWKRLHKQVKKSTLLGQTWFKLPQNHCHYGIVQHIELRNGDGLTLWPQTWNPRPHSSAWMIESMCSIDVLAGQKYSLEQCTCWSSCVLTDFMQTSGYWSNVYWIMQWCVSQSTWSVTLQQQCRQR